MQTVATGCYGSVAALVAPWRGARYRYRGRAKDRRPAAAEGCPYTPRQVCWLLLKAPAALTTDEAAYLMRLYHSCPQVALAEALVWSCPTFVDRTLLGDRLSLSVPPFVGFRGEIAQR